MASDRRKEIIYNDKTIIVHDYSNLEGEDFLNAIEENNTLATSDDRLERLVLVDVTNTIIDKHVLKAFKKMASNAPTRVSKSAVVGIVGIQQVFFTVIAPFAKNPMKSFDDRRSALDWLTS